ncbi:MAG: diguanylate cyclase, partial [Thermodesulfobacteriota bacterium]
STGDLTNLTSEEQAFLDAKDKITMCVSPDNPPFEFMNEKGDYEGIVADFYNVMSRKIGLPFQVVKNGSLKESLDGIQADECDIAAGVREKDVDSDTVILTSPYIRYPLVIATNSKAIYIDSIENISDRKIGISRDSHFSEDVRETYPGVDFTMVDSVEKGLSMVQNGELFGLVDTAPKIGYFIQNNEMVDLKISGELPYHVEFRTGIKKDDAVLYSIFEKAVNSLSSEEKKSIFQSWMTLKYEQGFDYSLLWKILAGLGIIGFFAVYRHISIAQYNVKLAGLNRELTRVNEKLETMSYIDGLTGVPNRRKFDSVLKNEWRRCGRSRQFLTLIMLDIDYFKLFNDRYGHLEGDDCLKKVAETISGIPGRPGDFVGRYGGEEFAVVLPGTDEAGARQIAEKILITVQNLKIEHEDSDVSPYLTVSLGAVTAVPGQRISDKDFVDTADQLLYKAKEAGRNQFRIEKL